MKKITLLFILLSFTAHSQVGIGPTTPNAGFEVSSTTNGVLLPRVALTDLTLAVPVTNPAGGAISNSTLVYNTSTTGVSPNNVVPGFYYWQTNKWIPLGASTKTSHYLGEIYNGGVIFYINKGSDGLEHGLILALTESVAKWQTTPTLVNSIRTEDGVYNTALMTGSPAADYIATLGSGWYLPSIDELALLYQNRYSVQKTLRDNGYTQISSDYYWSSTEYNVTKAFNFSFLYCQPSYYSLAANLKDFVWFVRGVRSF